MWNLVTETYLILLNFGKSRTNFNVIKLSSCKINGLIFNMVDFFGIFVTSWYTEILTDQTFCWEYTCHTCSKIDVEFNWYWNITNLKCIFFFCCITTATRICFWGANVAGKIACYDWNLNRLTLDSCDVLHSARCSSRVCDWCPLGKARLPYVRRLRW